ncbi:hypothetical protein [Flavobacterium hydatis]|uniref:Uncharacterized protein n=1 Tax=Flavobacterium hydatis TaxID=991 RepID=A0A086A5N4_FLAHY|nr:hypothetical protein [Flavobacterium hydatis]KFF11998.1 hypothetical protein IW20_18740 [Flavobacterium hydatis]OXA94251.1 hypothetical protein B0A62_11380 [Flavobacterium hydatis]
MIKKIVVLLLVVCTACQTTKIKNETYKIAISSPELGSIGQAEIKNGVENNFSIRTLPKLENKIRVSIGIVPFNRKLNQVYASKAKYNQNQTKVAYIDSLPKKPELVTIKIFDINGLVNELNANYNTDVFRLLKDTKDSQIITSLAVSLTIDEITKIRQADAYYLINPHDKKYLVILYKSGKKTETIDINPETIVGYQASKFCWSANAKGQWYIADIVTSDTNCKGNTKSIIPEGERKNKSLFDM